MIRRPEPADFPKILRRLTLVVFMSSPWIVAAVVLLSALNIGVWFLIWDRTRRRERLDPAPFKALLDAILTETRRVEESLRAESARQREESARSSASLRDELHAGQRAGFEGVLQRLEAGHRATEQRLDSFRDTLANRLGEHREAIDQRLESLSAILNSQLDTMRNRIDQRLDQLQQRNDAKLEEMRRTVDEKLQSTLERRLSESFQLVSDRLEQVHKGLGEMQAMAASVGDLKRVLSNVKTRGTWGEIQLGALLQQLLTPDQYATNVATRPGCPERVEFALRLPGPEVGGNPVWLPIDAKFPQEDYQRLLEAMDRADPERINEATRSLETRLRAQARDIQTKYLDPPHTTDFGILFLPSEGLYAEALRRPALAESLQREHRIVLAGPTTLGALLNSLQMGFRTLAIQQRSSEVWTVLGAIKTEFGRFGDALGRVKKKLEEASGHLEQTEVRTRAIQKRLRTVEELPASQAEGLLPPMDSDPDEVGST